jgi:hypothetical protein
VITYLYWIIVIGLAFGLVFLLGSRLANWKAAAVGAVLILLVGWAAYFFHFQQVFVKRFGGVMSIRVPDGQLHIAATWKDENLWIENYDPKTNECIFSEYSKGNLLEGRVRIKNCNPLNAGSPPTGLVVPGQREDQRQ